MQLPVPFPGFISKPRCTRTVVFSCPIEVNPAGFPAVSLLLSAGCCGMLVSAVRGSVVNVSDVSLGSTSAPARASIEACRTLAVFFTHTQPALSASFAPFSSWCRIFFLHSLASPLRPCYTVVGKQLRGILALLGFENRGKAAFFLFYFTLLKYHKAAVRPAYLFRPELQTYMRTPRLCRGYLFWFVDRFR